MEGFLYSVVKSKCPRCNLDNLYVDNNPYHLSKLGDMKKHCDKCNQRYEPETGFYYGAMYVSYGLGVAFMVVPSLLMYWLFDLGFAALLTFILSVYILAFPLFFRWSRNIWLNIFVKYNPEMRKELEVKATI
jgi:hypothetical protein